MKKFIAIFICLSQPSWAIWSVVQTKTTAGSTPCSVTLTSVSAGNAIVVSIKGGTGSVQPITSVTSTGDTWTSPVTSMSGADASAGFLDMWYLLSAAGGETSVTINSTVNTTNCYATELHSDTSQALFDVAGIRDQSTGSGSPLGVTLTLNGLNDAIIQNIKGGGTVSAVSSPYFPSGALAISNGIGASTNTASGTAPTWTQTAGNNAELNSLALQESTIKCSLTTKAAVDAGAVSSTALAYSGAVNSGDILLAGVYVGDTTNSPTVTDSINGSVNWNQDVSQVNTTDAHRVFIFSFLNSASGTPTVTVSKTGTANLRVLLASCSGIAITNALDQTVSSQGTGSSPSTGVTATRSTAQELLFAVNGNSVAGTLTAGANFMQLNEIPTGASGRFQDEFQAVSVVGTDAGTFNPSQTNWSSAIATYKVSGAVAAVITGQSILGDGIISGIGF